MDHYPTDCIVGCTNVIFFGSLSLQNVQFNNYYRLRYAIIQNGSLTTKLIQTTSHANIYLRNKADKRKLHA